MPLGAFFHKNVPLLELMYLVFTRMPGESYCRCLYCCVYVTYFER